ncbi:unnamed protein product, partial [Allacma fusca]
KPGITSLDYLPRYTVL